MPKREESDMKTEMTMIYWKSGKWWLGKLKEHPEIMTQGKSLKELEGNIKDAYKMMLMDDVPAKHHEKALAI
jgi:predicted RNase H-like HicB family nuclease